MPIVTEPFTKVAIVLVGTVSPRSARGHAYILTMIDFSTGFPEAIPLNEIFYVLLQRLCYKYFLVLAFLVKSCQIMAHSSLQN